MKMTMLPSRPDSIEYLLHEQFSGQRVVLIFDRLLTEAGECKKEPLYPSLNAFLGQSKLERFIGVLYKVPLLFNGLEPCDDSWIA